MITNNKEELKSLYEKDFYKWIIENVNLLKNKKFDLVDWNNMIEELESIGRNELRSSINFMATILEHLYKYENFRENENTENSWVKNIINSRSKLERLFIEMPSLKNKTSNELETAWKHAVISLTYWFKYPENKYLANKYFSRTPTGKDFPEKCPYTFEQILEYEPWEEEHMVKIYSDASLIEFPNYKIGGWCSIIDLNGMKISLQGKCIKKEANIHNLEYKASTNAILFATEILQIKPEELIVFIDNENAYHSLEKNKLNIKIKFIGGKEKKKSLKNKDKYFYHLCDQMSRKIAKGFTEKIKKQQSIHEIEKENIGIIRIINDIPEFIEKEICPIVIEKIRMIMNPKYKEKTDKNLDMLLEDSINEYINNKKILTIAIAKVGTNNQILFYSSAKEIIQAMKLKNKE
jgi:ribonuclease HI